MRAGLLDRTITIERHVETLDVYGVPTATWNVIATLRAELLHNETPEAVTNGGANESIQALRTFRTRFVDVNDHDRIIYQGAAYDIIDVVEIGRRRGLEIRARKRGL
jgi:SPP1 family predicted phage head-tail adaptor